MGLPMAENLQRYIAQKDEQALVYYNRTMSAGSSLQSLGAIPASSFTAMVKQCDIIFTMVSKFPPCVDEKAEACQVANDEVLESLLHLAIEDASDLSQKIFVDCSTVHPDTIEKLTAQLGKLSATLISAPVFGGPTVAIAGKLVFAIGGPESACEVVRPWILNVMGRKIISCGEHARSSSLLKIGGLVISIFYGNCCSQT